MNESSFVSSKLDKILGVILEIKTLIFQREGFSLLLKIENKHPDQFWSA
jgi:hypothetical protein